MPKPAPLPEQLKYLQPFRKKFSNCAPEELNEDTGLTPLLELWQKRIEGKTEGEAEALLRDDFVLLEKWLAESQQANDCLHFARGIFLICSPADIVGLIRNQSAERNQIIPWVEMELWQNVKPRRFEKEKDGGILVNFKEIIFAVEVVSETEATKSERPAEFYDSRDQVISQPVSFGSVTGNKFIQVSENRFGRPEKSIIYLLKVPGGHVKVSISYLGKRPSAKWDESKIAKYIDRDDSKWDEAPIESLLYTMRITGKQI